MHFAVEYFFVLSSLEVDLKFPHFLKFNQVSFQGEPRGDPISNGTQNHVDQSRTQIVARSIDWLISTIRLLHLHCFLKTVLTELWLLKI